jgi:hypothetical protein
MHYDIVLQIWMNIAVSRNEVAELLRSQRMTSVTSHVRPPANIRPRCRGGRRRLLMLELAPVTPSHLVRLAK